MATPLKIKDAGGNIQEFTTSEENYIAYQIGKHLAASGANGTGSITTNAAHTNIGSFVDTFFNEPVGTHPSTSITSGSTTTNVYQSQGTAPETDSDVYSPLMWVDSAGSSETGFKMMPDVDLNEAVDRYLATIFTNDYPGVFRLASSSPGVDYSVWLSSVFTDTRTDGTSVGYNIYRRDNYTAPTTVRPMFVEDSAGGSGIKIRAMNDRQIQYSFGQRAKTRIGASKIGTYQLRTSAQGAPTDPGTWVSKGSATDTKQTTSQQIFTRDSTSTFQQNYTRGYTNVYTLPYVKAYTNTYTATFDSTPYTTAYSGPLYATAYANQYLGNYTKPYVPNYIRGYTVPYTGTYERQFTAIFNTTYVGNYTQDYITNYTLLSFTGYYTARYDINYTGTYTNEFATGYAGDAFVSSNTVNYTGLIPYTSNFAGTYDRAFTLASVYTRSLVYTGAYTQTSFYSRLYTPNYIRTTLYLGPARYYVRGYTGAGAEQYYAGIGGITYLGNYTRLVPDASTFQGYYARNYTRNNPSTYYVRSSPVQYYQGSGRGGTQSYLGGGTVYYITNYAGPAYVGPNTLYYARNYGNLSVYERVAPLVYNRNYTTNYYTRDTGYIGFNAPVFYQKDLYYSRQFIQTDLYTRNVPYTIRYSRLYTSNYSIEPQYARLFQANYIPNYIRNYVSNFQSTDSVPQGPPGVSYQRGYSAAYSILYTQDYDANYQTNYTSAGYTKEYTAPTYTGNFESLSYEKAYNAGYAAAAFSTVYTSVNYTTDYTTDYSSTYDNQYVGTYTGAFNFPYSTDYIADYENVYNAEYLTDYIGNFEGNFEGLTIDNTSATQETYTLYVRIA
jgi:hypothetical protein